MVYVKYVIREMFQKTYVIRGLNENMLVIRDRDPPLPPCVVVEAKYFSTQNVVIHTENCNVNWNYHWIVQRPRWRGIFVECVA